MERNIYVVKGIEKGVTGKELRMEETALRRVARAKGMKQNRQREESMVEALGCNYTL